MDTFEQTSEISRCFQGSGANKSADGVIRVGASLDILTAVSNRIRRKTGHFENRRRCHPERRRIG